MKPYRYIALGGFVGAIIRYSISEHWLEMQPLSILWINITGSFLLALLYSFITVNMRWHREIRWTFGIGLLGAFTTFSTFSLTLLNYLELEQYGDALLYMLGNVAGGGFAAMIAIILVDKLRGRKVAS